MKTTTQVQHSSAVAMNRAAPAVIAFVFGMFIVWGTGFALPTEIHNAAHDGRHAFALPCH